MVGLEKGNGLTQQGEAKLSRKIMNEIRAKGYFCFKVHGGPTMMAGLPDIIVCADGYYIGLETKLPSKRKDTSPRQDYVHELIRQAGGTAVVVCSAVEALRVIDQVLNDPE